MAAELQQVSPPVATPPEEPLDSVPTNTSHPPTPVEVAPDVPANDAGDEYDDAVEFYDMVTDGEAEGTEVERPAALKDTFDL